MSATTGTPMAVPLVTGAVQAFYAPVNRATESPAWFDPSQSAAWSGGEPAAPWVSLGLLRRFERASETAVSALAAGVPMLTRLRTRAKVGATLTLEFARWSKLTMALASGSEHMNLLAPAAGAAAVSGSGGAAAPANALTKASTASVLYTAAATGIAAGAVVVVDGDYARATGFVGAGGSGAYVGGAAPAPTDVDYVRRVSMNVARVQAVGADGGLQLASPLPGGMPGAGMKVQAVSGFADREGCCFFQEWSGLFLARGMQGEALCFFYPRLQVAAGSQETVSAIGRVLQCWTPTATYRALPVTDPNDGTEAVCFRSYLPPAMSQI